MAPCQQKTRALLRNGHRKHSHIRSPMFKARWPGGGAVNENRGSRRFRKQELEGVPLVLCTVQFAANVERCDSLINVQQEALQCAG
eukprot:3738412-Amphidinium_carterae.1